MVQCISREAGLESFIKAIQQDGCVIVQDFTDLDSLLTAQKEVQPYLDASTATKSTVGALNGGTATCTRLVGRSQTVREKFFSDPLYQVRKETALQQSLISVHYQEEHGDVKLTR
jgi:hypothetical protein